MPKIAEIREIDGEVWVRIGKAGEFENGITLWTPEEVERKYEEGVRDGISKLNSVMVNMQYKVGDRVDTFGMGKNQVVVENDNGILTLAGDPMFPGGFGTEFIHEDFLNGKRKPWFYLSPEQLKTARLLLGALKDLIDSGTLVFPSNNRSDDAKA